MIIFVVFVVDGAWRKLVVSPLLLLRRTLTQKRVSVCVCVRERECVCVRERERESLTHRGSSSKKAASSCFSLKSRGSSGSARHLTFMPSVAIYSSLSLSLSLTDTLSHLVALSLSFSGLISRVFFNLIVKPVVGWSAATAASSTSSRASSVQKKVSANFIFRRTEKNLSVIPGWSFTSKGPEVWPPRP